MFTNATQEARRVLQRTGTNDAPAEHRDRENPGADAGRGADAGSARASQEARPPPGLPPPSNGDFPKEMQAWLKGVLNEMRKDVQKYGKSWERVNHLSQDIVTLSENRLPPGLSAYKFGYESEYLDEPLSAGAEEGKITLPQGLTVRQAKIVLHKGYLRAQKIIDLGVAKND